MTLKRIAILQALTIAIVMVARNVFIPAYYIDFFYAFVIAHYLLGLYYSVPYLKKTTDTKKGLVLSVLTIPLGLIFYFFQWPNVYLFFGLHHSVTETYIVKDANHFMDRLSTLVRFFINMTTAVYITGELGGIVIMKLPAVIALVFLYCVLLGLNSRRLQSQWQMLLLSAFAPLIVIALPFKAISFFDMGLYHIVFWLIYPMLTTFKLEVRKFGTYLFVHCLMNFLFYKIITDSLFTSYLSPNIFLNVFCFLGYIHFTTSFRFSRYNPGWLITLTQSPKREN